MADVSPTTKLVCTGCGNRWSDADLAARKAADPRLLACCPERDMQPTTRPDIVLRLRAVDHMDPADCFTQSPLLAQAADEIELLRAAIHGMLTWVETRPSPHPYDTWKAARRAVGLPNA